jgi:O-antigen/teichoic acid export membrane protein
VWFVENSGILFAGFMGSTESAGIYKVGYTLSQIIVLVIFAFQQAWGPYALSVHKEEGSRDFFALVFKAYLLATVVLGTFLSLFAAEMLKLLFPPQYAGANGIVLLLTFGHILAGLYYIGVTGLVIAKNMKPYGMITMAIAALTLLGNAVLTNKVGDAGPALVYFLAKALTVLAIFYFSQREYRIPYGFAPGTFVFALGVLVSFLGNSAEPAVSGLQTGIGKLVMFLSLVGILSLINKTAIIKAYHFVAGKIKN